MNRYLIGAVIAGLLLLAMSGLGGINRFFADDNDSTRVRSVTRADESDSLGTLPIEQAGRVVQRQSQPTTGSPRSTSTNAFGQNSSAPTGDLSPDFTSPAGLDSAIPNATINPSAIPRPVESSPLSTTGDISPVQPDLVRPEIAPPTVDENLDSIPALW